MRMKVRDIINILSTLMDKNDYIEFESPIFDETVNDLMECKLEKQSPDIHSNEQYLAHMVEKIVTEDGNDTRPSKTIKLNSNTPSPNFVNGVMRSHLTSGVMDFYEIYTQLNKNLNIIDSKYIVTPHFTATTTFDINDEKRYVIKNVCGKQVFIDDPKMANNITIDINSSDCSATNYRTALDTSIFALTKARRNDGKEYNARRICFLRSDLDAKNIRRQSMINDTIPVDYKYDENTKSMNSCVFTLKNCEDDTKSKYLLISTQIDTEGLEKTDALLFNYGDFTKCLEIERDMQKNPLLDIDPEKSWSLKTSNSVYGFVADIWDEISDELKENVN